MKNHRVEYSIDGMCACFGVSRSGYYAWLQRIAPETPTIG